MNKFERDMVNRWMGKKPKAPEPVVKIEFTCLDKDAYLEFLEDKVIQLEKELNAAKQKASQYSINNGTWELPHYYGGGTITFRSSFGGSDSGSGDGGV